MNQSTKRRWSLGWVAVLILLGLYLGLKVDGWWYGLSASRLERRLKELRPTLSAIVLHEQLENTRQACTDALQQIRRLGFQGGRFLEQLSQQIPPSVALTQFDVGPKAGVRIRGTFMPGVRSPEAVLVPWVQRIQAGGITLRIHEMAPDRWMPQLWYFELTPPPASVPPPGGGGTGPKGLPPLADEAGGGVKTEEV